MTEWFATQDGLWSKAWDLFEATGEPRFIALATQGADGPANRLVVIREADRAAATVTIYTDAASVKIGELHGDPRAALAYWRSADQIQVRLEGQIGITTGDALRDEWEALTETQRGNYGVMPPPGTPVDASDAYARVPDFDKFARLQFAAHSIDIVYLGRDHHRRAIYTRDGDWHGQWRAP